MLLCSVQVLALQESLEDSPTGYSDSHPPLTRAIEGFYLCPKLFNELPSSFYYQNYPFVRTRGVR